MHYLLMVIGENPEQQLAPYSAETPYTPQVDTTLTPEAIMEHLQATIQSLERHPDDDSILEQAGALRAMLDDMLALGYQEGARRHLESFEAFMLDRYNCQVDDAVRPIRLFNPQIKFDRHEIGGRWSGRLKLVPGAQHRVSPIAATRPPAGFADQCRRQELDWPGSQEAARQDAAQRWDAELERAPHRLPFDQKRDTYIQEASREALIPEAIVDNGQYIEGAKEAPGAWEAAIHRRLQEMPPETLITLYDCHN